MLFKNALAERLDLTLESGLEARLLKADVEATDASEKRSHLVAAFLDCTAALTLGILLLGVFDGISESRDAGNVFVSEYPPVVTIAPYVLDFALFKPARQGVVGNTNFFSGITQLYPIQHTN
jgi:hypothetical protein